MKEAAARRVFIIGLAGLKEELAYAPLSPSGDGGWGHHHVQPFEPQATFELKIPAVPWPTS